MIQIKRRVVEIQTKVAEREILSIQHWSSIGGYQQQRILE